jgi:transketolase
MTATHTPLSLTSILSHIANTIRGLTMDAVEQAGSGHAGTPMGCAEIGAYLYGYFLKHHPRHPDFPNRDRFILSAGHASMLQYACLHLSGYSMTLDDLKRFRQLNSITPSHPQYGLTPGVETTTGLDGQGIGHGVGQALGLKLLGAKFNRGPFSLYDGKVIILAGDGCFMEGICHEACALAGHLKLNNLILIYDRNQTCLDGYVSESCSEDTKKRFEAYGWDVKEVDGHDLDALHDALSPLRQEQHRPVLIIADTIIGKGAPTLAGSYLVHNEPLEKQERHHAKEALGLSSEEFAVPQEIRAFFDQKLVSAENNKAEWDQSFALWANTYPELHAEFEKMTTKSLPNDLEKLLAQLPLPNVISGRKASHAVVNFLAEKLSRLYGGSADLARSDMTHFDAHPVVLPDRFEGRNIKYGVREFAMATLAIGMAQTQMIIPFIGTFLAFSDYMLSAIRMAALMRLPILYQLTHDSIFIGQDGPTHQPIEQLAHLRAIPHLQVIRPADANEVKQAWLAALNYAGPTALVLSRQALPACAGTNQPFAEGMGRGAYILKDADKPLDFTLIATGSEVSLALSVAEALSSQEYAVRVISMPCWQLFDAQPETYKKSLLGNDSGKRISIEAAASLGWHKYILDGKAIAIDTFGKSALPKDLAQEFGFVVDSIIKEII